jgi:hypothetical protein
MSNTKELQSRRWEKRAHEAMSLIENYLFQSLALPPSAHNDWSRHTPQKQRSELSKRERGFLLLFIALLHSSLIPPREETSYDDEINASRKREREQYILPEPEQNTVIYSSRLFFRENPLRR